MVKVIAKQNRSWPLESSGNSMSFAVLQIPNHKVSLHLSPHQDSKDAGKLGQYFVGHSTSTPRIMVINLLLRDLNHTEKHAHKMDMFSALFLVALTGVFNVEDEKYFGSSITNLG
ncbi:hypothetical protein PoB_006521500 [Plakobranchus ocellatus]|uniref:Uncharacterized protein n=1 Tax=Plakobranchus ocellatus TaxID=259542 RepID=A0AAV4D3J4_9GAST|nr:hypothetical protein PoB_006521500 [Plakobranchus ocellatus]